MLRSCARRALDILIDLDGYCEGSRPDLFALRAGAAAGQLARLSGHARRAMVRLSDRRPSSDSDEQRAHYSEKIALSAALLSTDATPRADRPTPLRAASFGLPRNRHRVRQFQHQLEVYFAQFCALDEDSARQVPDSVLWLLAGPPAAPPTNICAAPRRAAGVDPQRLVFATRVRTPSIWRAIATSICFSTPIPTMRTRRPAMRCGPVARC